MGVLARRSEPVALVAPAVNRPAGAGWSAWLVLCYLLTSAVLAVSLGLILPPEVATSWGYPPVLAASAAGGLGLTLLLHRRWAGAGAAHDRPAWPQPPAMRTWTAVCVGAAVGCVLIGAWATPVPVSVTVTVLASALAEELAFRRLPRALQRRLARPGAASTILFAAGTTAAFVMLHDNRTFLPTADKVVFALCAYAICVLTNSLAIPVALHVAGNAVAASWVTSSATGSAVAVFSVSSILVSLVVVTVTLGIADTRYPVAATRWRD